METIQLANELSLKTELRPKMVLIDDDPVFCKVMSSYAILRGIQLDCFKTLGEMGSLGRFSDYEAAIVDYDLGPMNGLEVAEYLPIFFRKMPMILISGKEIFQETYWPSSVKDFVHKETGPNRILDVAVSYLAGRDLY